jgi:subtilase family serine protease
VLGPGVSSTGSVTATIPAATPGGAYYLIAVADGDNTVAETQEANNTFNRNLLIGPDLGMLALSLPTDSGAGLTISIVDQTRNAGGGTAPATTTSFYLSADATLDAGDVLLGSRAVPSLAAGGISTGTTSVTIPAGTATGTYNVFARADATDAVPETYENNNTTSRTLRIGPDLTVESLTVPGSAAPAPRSRCRTACATWAAAPRPPRSCATTSRPTGSRAAATSSWARARSRRWRRTRATPRRPRSPSRRARRAAATT